MIFAVFIFLSIIGGTNAALVKFTTNQFQPVVFVFLRSLIAVLILLPFVFSDKVLKKANFLDKRLIFPSLLFAFNWILFAIGLQYTSVIMSQLIYVPSSLIVAFIGYLFLREKLSFEQIAGLALTIVGVLILILGSVITRDQLSFGSPLGNFLIILGLFSWSVYLVSSRRISKTYTPLTITFFNFAVSAFAALLLLPLQVRLGGFGLENVDAKGILAIFAVAIFNSALFFWLYQWIIKHTSAFVSSLILYPITAVAAASGVLFFGEKLSFSLILGAVFILLGIFAATSYQYVRRYIGG